MSNNAWDDLRLALGILSKHPGGYSPFHCEHDTLYVLCSPEDFDTQEISHLDELGFFVNEEEDCFMSYRFGSA